MGFVAELKAFFRREGRAVSEWIGGAIDDGHATLDQVERRTSDDPEERLRATLDDIEAGDESYEATRARARVEAAAEAADRPGEGSQDRTP